MLQRRLRQLQNRFIAVNMRSRSLRLARAARHGALDLSRLEQWAPSRWEALRLALGQSAPASLTLAPERSPEEEVQRLSHDLRALAQAARDDLMETGAQDLAVGWPLLEGRTQDGTWLRAPLLLYPARLDTTEKGLIQWQLSLSDPPDLNQSLIQALRRLAGVRMELEDILSLDEDQVLAMDDSTWRDLGRALRAMDLPVEEVGEALPALEPLQARSREERELLPLHHFTLQHCAVLGRFPRSGSNLVQDYDEMLLEQNQALSSGLAAEILAVDEDTPWQEGQALEDQEEAEQASSGEDGRRWQVMASDSSQDAVFRFLSQDQEHGLVVQGPPGTGKSQLIANLVASCIAQGQRVLLVCQKRAALDVVADRLGQVGLRDPVAVVHDVQRDRNAVCDAIAQTIEDARQQRDPQQQGGAQIQRYAQEHEQALERLRARLGASQRAFEALTTSQGRPCLAKLQEAALADPGHALPELTGFAGHVTTSEALALRPRLDSLAHDAERYAAPHPLHQRGDWARASPERLQQAQEQLQHLHKLLLRMGRRPGQLTPEQAYELQEIWEEGDEILRILEGKERSLTEDFLLFWTWTGGEAEHGEWSQVMSQLRQAQRTLRFTPYELVIAPRAWLQEQIGQLQRLKELSARWYRLFVPEFWRLRKVPGQVLARCTSLQQQSALVDVEALCQAALPWQELIEALPADNPVLDFGFQGDPAELSEAIKELSEKHNQVRALHRLYNKLSQHGGAYAQRPTLDPSQDPDQDPFVDAVLGDWHQAQNLEEALSLLHGLGDVWRREALEALEAQTRQGELLQAAQAVEDILGAWGDAAALAEQDRATQGDPAWLRHFLRHWRRHPEVNASPSSDAQTALERAWRALHLGGQSARAVEAPLVDEEQLHDLNQALEQSRAVAGQGLLARFQQRLAQAHEDKQASRALRKLAAQARKKRYRLTLRQLVEQYWGVGLSLARPAWFCSPESVAALFPLQRELFDLVIFDEASQCPVEAAVPTLARARHALIAGDDQQMPPSHFFKASQDELEDEEEDSAVLASHSLLALARVAFADTTLRWHYRSRHEELVAFSNAAFYGGRLITAPRRDTSNEALEGLHWHPVEGYWSEQRNEREAQQVVELLGQLWRQQRPEGGPPSVGIVTFNRKQAEQIEETLRLRAAQDQALHQALALDRQRPVVEQLFVRNLENVQGDERDIILFSVGYGPDEPGGRVRARFGPLGQQGGHKRLNVAITRGRLGMHVVCSFDPDSLQVGQSKHLGPRFFQLWLRYVRAQALGRHQEVEALLEEAGALGGGQGVTGAHKQREGELPLGREVRKALEETLRRRGWRVQRGLGLGSQRLDLAVGAPGEHGWRLGIDCGEFLHTSDSLARDVYAPLFWRRLGWRVLRVSPAMWLHQREKTLKRITALLRA